MKNRGDDGDPSDHINRPDTLHDDLLRAEAAKKGSPYLDMTQAAHYLRISPRTLQKKCRDGTGPKVHRIGERPRFLVRELDEWASRPY